MPRSSQQDVVINTLLTYNFVVMGLYFWMEGYRLGFDNGYKQGYERAYIDCEAGKSYKESGQRKSYQRVTKPINDFRDFLGWDEDQYPLTVLTRQYYFLKDTFLKNIDKIKPTEELLRYGQKEN